MDPVTQIVLGVLLAAVGIKLFNFWNLTWPQCREFGNCPYWWPERFR